MDAQPTNPRIPVVPAPAGRRIERTLFDELDAEPPPRTLAPLPPIASVVELKERYGLTALRADRIQSFAPQLEFLERWFRAGGDVSSTAGPPGSEVVHAPTGTGKTFVALMAASREISTGSVVLYFTPKVELVNQAAGEALTILTLPSGSLLRTTSASAPGIRERSYAEREVALVVSTPEAFLNDLESGRVPESLLSRVRVAVFDECHRTRGDYAYARLAPHLTKRAVRILGLSASPAETRDELRELLDALGGARCTRVHFPEAIRREAKCLVALEPERVTAAAGLATVAASAYAQLRDLLDPPTPSLFPARPSQPPPSFRFPPMTEMRELDRGVERINPGARSSAAPESIERYHEARSLWCGLSELRHLHLLVTTMGSFSFLDHAGERLAAVRFNLGADSRPRFWERVYRHPTVSAVFSTIAAGTPYEPLANSKRWSDVVAAVKLGPVPDADWAAFSRTARGAMVRRATFDHPKEETLLSLLQDVLAESEPGTSLVFCEHALQCRYLSERINHLLGARGFRATWLAGGSRMRAPERRASLASFRDGSSNVMVCTSVAEEGLHLPEAARLYRWSPLVEAKRSVQQGGRVGRRGALSHESGGAIFHLLAAETEDMQRYYAGLQRLAKMRRTLGTGGA